MSLDFELTDENIDNVITDDEAVDIVRSVVNLKQQRMFSISRAHGSLNIFDSEDNGFIIPDEGQDSEEADRFHTEFNSVLKRVRDRMEEKPSITIRQVLIMLSGI